MPISMLSTSMPRFNNDILVASGSMANYQYTNSDGTPQVSYSPVPTSTTRRADWPTRTTIGSLSSRGMSRVTMGMRRPFARDLKYDLNQAGSAGWTPSRPEYVTRIGTRTCAIRRSTGRRSPRAGTAMVPVSMPTIPHPVHIRIAPRAIRTSRATARESGAPQISALLQRQCLSEWPARVSEQPDLTNFQRLVSALCGAATNSPIGGGYVPICDRAGATVGLLYALRGRASREKTECRLCHAEFRLAEHGDLRTHQRSGQRRGSCRADRGIQQGSVGFPSSTDLSLWLHAARRWGPIRSSTRAAI